MGNYDGIKNPDNKAEIAIANELYRANVLKRIEIDLMAFQVGLTKVKRKELQTLMDEA